MKIALLAPFEEPVPPKRYGGTEVVVYNLITELLRLEHDVTLFATGDSEVPCKLVPIFPSAIRTSEPFASDQSLREKAKFLGIGKVLSYLLNEHFDLIHNHIGWRFCSFAPLVKRPMITTLHGPPGDTYNQLVFREFPHLSFVSISNNQRQSMPALDYAATVYNGIDLSLYPYKEKPDGDYLLFLARFSPEKGPREAIEIAKRTKKRLVMAVKVDAYDIEYFEETKAMMGNADIEIIGEVNMEEKIRLLQNAQALLAPIQWEEPFGLFVTEAMACGTPVIGTRRGSFPEIITHEVDGFLGSTIDDLVSYVSRIGEVSRSRCRETIKERFSKECMAKDYVTVYEALIQK